MSPAAETAEERPFRSVEPGPEPSRARYPDEEGHVEDESGVRVFWERYGDGEPTLLYMTTPWPIVHSRAWKAHIPYFARHRRVVVFDPRGNGRSDRPKEPEAYGLDRIVGDAVRVLDASGTEQAVVVAGARGAQPALVLAAEHPERVRGLVLLGPQPHNQRQMVEAMMKGRLDRYEGWDKFNPEYWKEDFHGFLEWFAAENVPEGHYTRFQESMIEYGLGTDAETLIAASFGRGLRKSELPGVVERIGCPSLVICGDRDTINPPELSRRVAELVDAPLVMLEGAGHSLASQVVPVLLLIRRFVEDLE